VALKKQCRCGNIIDYSQRYCPECESKVKQEKTESNKQYDKNVRALRDKKYTSFYHSSDWVKTTGLVKSKFNYLDIYSYYIEGKIEYGNICHHIREIKSKQGWEDRLRADTIVYLTHENHALIHSMMDKDYQRTVRMLEELIDRWNKEFSN
jgi:5-methylcytosine-specific restriction enzyme A